MCLCSRPNTEAETARPGDLVLDNNLILLDSEIPKPHKNPNFDRLAKSIGISLGTALFHMRSGSDPRGSANARPGTARLGAKSRAVAGQAGLSRAERHTQ